MAEIAKLDKNTRYYNMSLKDAAKAYLARQIDLTRSRKKEKITKSVPYQRGLHCSHVNAVLYIDWEKMVSVGHLFLFVRNFFTIAKRRTAACTVRVCVQVIDFCGNGILL